MNRWIDSAANKFIGAMVGSTVVVWGFMAVYVALTEDRQFPWLNTAFCVTWLLSMLMVLPIVLHMKKRPADQEPTWGEAMLGSAYVFFILFWIYGVVPHQFLTFTDSELAWRSDRLLVGPNMPGTDEGILSFALPFTLNYVVLRDIIVVIIYNIYFGMQIWLWIMWQNRGKTTTSSTDLEQTSRYGRPVMKRRVPEGAGV